MEPPPPHGVSVYESILPASIAYRPVQTGSVVATPATAAVSASSNGKKAAAATGSSSENAAAAAAAPPPAGSTMPLIAHLRQGALNEPVGWHRNAERRARGMFPVTSLSTQLEPWERQLALVEILLLSGGTPNSNFKDLAHAWGREKGFHQVLASSVCERKGEVERKRRSDAGKVLSALERESFRKKAKKSKENNGGTQQEPAGTGAGYTVATAPPTVGEFGDLNGVHNAGMHMEEADLHGQEEHGVLA